MGALYTPADRTQGVFSFSFLTLQLPRTLWPDSAFNALGIRELAPAAAARARVHNFHPGHALTFDVRPNVCESFGAGCIGRNARPIPIVNIRAPVENGPQRFEVIFVARPRHDVDEMRRTLFFALLDFEGQMRARLFAARSKGGISGKGEGFRRNHGSKLPHAHKKSNSFLKNLLSPE